jgi:hypothetical protein
MRPVLPVLLGFVVFALPSLAYGAGPTARVCVSANEASGKLVDEQKLRAAREQLLICGQASCPQEVRAECIHQVDEINAHLPTVVFSAKLVSGQDLAAVRVTMDGEVLTDHLDGAPLVVDPGSHTLTFETADEPVIHRTFVFREGEKGRREPIVFGSASAAGAPAAAGGQTQRIVGVVGATVGAIGIAAGAVLGAFATSEWSKAKNACPKETACSPTAVQESRDTQTYATASTALLVAGGVVLAGGVTVFMLAPKEATTVGLKVGPGGLLLGGSF